MKILAVKLHALGDLVIATPALRRLREGLPGARIELLTTRWTAPAAQGNPAVDRMMVIDDGLFYAPGVRTLPSTIRLVRRLAREGYDAAVLFHRHRMVDRLIAFAGIDVRFRFSDRETRRSVFLNERRHSALTAWELADLAVRESDGITVAPPELSRLRYEWFVSDDEERSAVRVMRESGLESGRFVVIFPGGGVNPNSRDVVRRWGVQRFAELARRLFHQPGVRIVLSGGGSDEAVSAAIARECGTGAVNLCGRLHIRIAAALTRHAAVAVANDSGPLHIAAAVGTPVVGIFGPTGVDVKSPPGGTNRAVSLNLPCSPCYFGVFKGCIFDRPRCLEELTVDMVCAAVRELLSGSGRQGMRYR